MASVLNSLKSDDASSARKVFGSCTQAHSLFCNVSVADCGGNGATVADLAEAQHLDLLLSLTVKMGAAASSIFS